MSRPDWGALQQEYIAEYTRSGISPVAWCEARGLNYATARRYIKKPPKNAQTEMRKTAQKSAQKKSAQTAQKRNEKSQEKKNSFAVFRFSFPSSERRQSTPPQNRMHMQI